MAKITVLHISDFHFDQKAASDTKLVVKGFLEDVPYAMKQFDLKPDFAIFSGDLVNSGAVIDDFKSLRNVLTDPLIAVAGLTEDRFFIAPGNHDIDKKCVDDNPPIQLGLEALDTRDKINAFYDSHHANPKTAFYFSRLDNFVEAASPFGKAHLVSSNPFFSAYRLDIGDQKVGIAIFNSAWTATGKPNDYDRGKLAIPERAVTDAVELLKDCTFNIATVHHPFEYYRDGNRSNVRALILKHFNLFCTGHVHEPMPEKFMSAVGQAVLSQAGALYSHRDWYNGYCFIEFDLAKNKVRFVHRKWEDSPAYKFVETVALGSKGVVEYPLSDSAEILRVNTLVDVNRELKNILAAQADEQLLSFQTTTTAPKSIDDIYIPLPIFEQPQSDAEQTGGNRGPELSAIEVVAGEKPTIVYGGRESGKTTLAHHLALKLCDSITPPIRTPILIDLALVTATPSTISREVKKALAFAQLQDKSKELMEAGSFVFIFDNFLPDQRRKALMISDLVKDFSKNAVVILTDQGHTPIKREKIDGLNFEWRSLYIHQLKRQAVRELTRRWLEPSAQYSPVVFHSLMARLKSANLPATPYIVSMLALTVEKNNATGAINEATLLQLFVESLLNKADPKGITRADTDYTIKSAFLAELAHHLASKETVVISRLDLSKFAISYIEKHSWDSDPLQFVQTLIDTGVFICSDELVAFRYRFLREYFLALYIIEHEDYRADVLKKENFLRFSRELDILTGLRRRDADIIEKVMSHVDELVAENIGIEDLSAFEKTEITTLDKILGRRPDSLGLLKITDETIEAMLDKQDDETAPPAFSDDLQIATNGNGQTNPKPKEGNEEGGEAGDEKSPEERFFGVTATITALTSFARIVRNSELVADPELKRKAVQRLVEHWSALIMWVSQMFDKLKESEDARGEEYRKLDPQKKEVVEFFMKVLMPGAMSTVLYETVGTEKLNAIFVELFKPNSDQPLVVRLMMAFLLLEGGYAESGKAPSPAVKKVEDFLKEKHPRYIDEVITLKLFFIYLRPNIGAANREKIESIYIEHQSKQLKAKVRGAQAQEMATNLRKQREKIVSAIDPVPLEEENEPVPEGGGEKKV